MKNLNEDTKSNGTSCSLISDNIKKAIFKAGLNEFSTADLCLYLEGLVEVINERKAESENK